MFKSLVAISAINFCLFCSPALAEEYPFKYIIGQIEESTETPGWSVLTLTVENTEAYFIDKIEFYCQFKNDGGYTWAGAQKVSGLKKGDTQTIRLAAKGDTEMFNKPTAAKCLIAKFEQATFFEEW